MAKKVIPLDWIIPDAAKRARVDQEYIDELAALYLGGECELPDPVVFHVKGSSTYFLGDGFNRVSAARKAGLNGLQCEIHEGDYDDALCHSAGANNSHGLRPSLADRRKKVTEMLESKRWKSKSDRWLGETCGLAHGTVATIRAQLVNSPVEGESREGKDGKTRKAKPKPAKDDDKPKPGQELFDFAAYFSHLNAMRRAPDHMYRAHGKQRKDGAIDRDSAYDTLSRLLEGFHASFEARWLELAKQPFPKQ